MKEAVNGETPNVPDEIVGKWQQVVNTIAELLHVPAALIMRVDPPHIEVFRASESPGNPYEVGAREHLRGLYCETVIEKRDRLLIPNALKDEKWKHNPDIKLGMTAYLGFPLIWPNGEVFGTVCALDSRENAFGGVHERLLSQFRDLIEGHLALLFRSREIEAKADALAKSLAEIRTLRGILPICASCKKIRDDDGYWQAVEDYISDHSEAVFSHGICPECRKRLYPELFGGKG
ncbi:MAG: GAF domain-containing protein [Candidatus Eisenbacteria bacterium]|nr:GAF domain-containing protein [Candidatus Eisenbacteria bacterium]